MQIYMPHNKNYIYAHVITIESFKKLQQIHSIQIEKVSGHNVIFVTYNCITEV